MYFSFFSAAAQSPARQYTFRALVAFHLLALLGCLWTVHNTPATAAPRLGLFLLVAGIVEGALLLGWRLTQLPKSRALEFVLASPLRPARIFLTEAIIGWLRLALVTCASLPVLLLLVLDGYCQPVDVVPLLVLPLTWGAVCGLGLTMWAYEPARVRFWGEKALLLLVLVYLVIGVLAGEHLKTWIEGLPAELADFILSGYYACHTYNPFAIMHSSLAEPRELVWQRWLLLELAALLTVVVLLARAALRFQGHYQERHYSPIFLAAERKRPPVGDRPLSWWAIKRVSEYAGKVNLWLAGGFGLLYALHTLAGDHWPGWLGRQVFLVFDQYFGIAGVATALVVLGAVPAAFQYGLWDSNTQDRCRRLELLLLTQLHAEDYWAAALAAAWRRGSGYLSIALLLWLAAVLGGKMTALEALRAVAASTILWLLYFALGFRAFTTGMQASSLGLLLTIALPLLTVGLFHSGYASLGALTPPGFVYAASTSLAPTGCVLGVTLAAMTLVVLHRQALARCEIELQRWYEKFHGHKVMD